MASCPGTFAVNLAHVVTDYDRSAFSSTVSVEVIEIEQAGNSRYTDSL